MELFIRISQLILSLSLLVLLHEMGHFFTAKWFKTRVEKFYLFFNPWFSLFKVKKGETEYGIGWLPFGGYVKIAGMIDESMDKEQMRQTAKPDEFRSKKPWQRLIIILAGVFVNIALACIINIGSSYTWGEKYLPNDNLKYGVVCSDVAKENGFKDGDKIISINGEKVERFSEIEPRLLIGGDKEVEVSREGRLVKIIIDEKFVKSRLENSSKSFSPNFSFSPRYLFAPFVVQSIAPKSVASQSEIKPKDEILKINGQAFKYYDEFQNYIRTQVNKRIILTVLRAGEIQEVTVDMGEKPIIGVALSMEGRELFDFKSRQFGFGESVRVGLSRTYGTLGNYIKSLGLIFTKEGASSIGGIGTMATLFPTYWSWQVFWSITAFLSVMFAFLNVLPIPGLDGGHAIFIIYEMISGRKPSIRFMEIVQMIGVLFLLFLIIFANGNDLFRLLR